MSRYFQQMRSAPVQEDYPLADRFLQRFSTMSVESLRALQEQRFALIMKRCWNIPFYQRRWQKVGLEPGDIKGLDDIEKIPPFTKRDLLESVETYPPFGDFHGMDDMKDTSRVILQTTSGTTGTPQPILWDATDREIQNILLARAYIMQGMTDDDVVHSVYGFGMVNGGHYIREAVLHHTAALLLPAGTGVETSSVRQVQLMKQFGATMLVGFGDYLFHLARVAREQGLIPGQDIPLRMICGHINHATRQELEDLWGGAKVFDWYGVGDTGLLAAEGPDRDGLYVMEDAQYVEVIDPTTSKQLAVGEKGCVCVTSLFKSTIYPIVRFNVQDLSTLHPRDPNGHNIFRKMAGFQGRHDDMVKLRGVNVFPSSIGAFFDQYFGQESQFVCIVTRQNDRDSMEVLVEISDEQRHHENVQKALTEQLGVSVLVSFVPPGATAEHTGLMERQKPRRLIDRRG